MVRTVGERLLLIMILILLLIKCVRGINTRRGVRAVRRVALLVRVALLLKLICVALVVLGRVEALLFLWPSLGGRGTVSVVVIARLAPIAVVTFRMLLVLPLLVELSAGRSSPDLP